MLVPLLPPLLSPRCRQAASWHQSESACSDALPLPCRDALTQACHQPCMLAHQAACRLGCRPELRLPRPPCSEAPSDAFERLFALSFRLLDAVWLEQRATYMEFPAVLR